MQAIQMSVGRLLASSPLVPTCTRDALDEKQGGPSSSGTVAFSLRCRLLRGASASVCCPASSEAPPAAAVAAAPAALPCRLLRALGGDPAGFICAVSSFSCIGEAAAALVAAAERVRIAAGWVQVDSSGRIACDTLVIYLVRRKQLCVGLALAAFLRNNACPCRGQAFTCTPPEGFANFLEDVGVAGRAARSVRAAGEHTATSTCSSVLLLRIAVHTLGCAEASDPTAWRPVAVHLSCRRRRPRLLVTIHHNSSVQADCHLRPKDQCACSTALAMQWLKRAFGWGGSEVRLGCGFAALALYPWLACQPNLPTHGDLGCLTTTALL